MPNIAHSHTPDTRSAAATADAVHVSGLGLYAAQTSDVAEPPKRLKVLPWGVTETRRGKIIVDEKVAQELPQRMKAERRDRVAIDFEHATALRSDKSREANEPVVRAGFGTMEVVPGDGIYLTDIRWTRAGRAHFDSYEDLSPAIKLNHEGRVTLLDSVALCEHGEVNGLTLFSAEEWAARLNAVVNKQNPNPNINSRLTMKDVVLKLLSAVGVNAPDDADDATLAQLADDVISRAQAEAQKKTKPDNEAALSAELEQKLAALEAKESQHERAALLHAAAAEGKVIPLSDEAAAKLSIDDLRTMIDKLPVTVPLSRRSGEPGENEDEAALTAAQREVNQMLGITDEQWQKFNAKK